MRPSRGCSPFLRARMPWKARRAGPPHTAMSPWRSAMRRVGSLRFAPPNWNVAGRPSETETIGWVKSRSLVSRWRLSRAPGA